MSSYISMRSDEVKELCQNTITRAHLARKQAIQDVIDSERKYWGTRFDAWLRRKPFTDAEILARAEDRRMNFSYYFARHTGAYSEQVARTLSDLADLSSHVNVSGRDLDALTSLKSYAPGD